MPTIYFYHACFTFSLLLTYTFNSVAFAQIFNPVAELVIPIGIPRKEVKAEMEIDSVIVEAKIKSVQYNLDLYQPFYAF